MPQRAGNLLGSSRVVTVRLDLATRVATHRAYLLPWHPAS